MKKIYRMISVLLACSLVLSISNTLLVSAQVLSPAQKISTHLLETINAKNENEKVRVWLWFRDIDKSEVINSTNKECGFSYEDIIDKDLIPSSLLNVEEANSLLPTNNLESRKSNILNYKKQTEFIRKELDEKTHSYKTSLLKHSEQAYVSANQYNMKQLGLKSNEVFFVSRLTPSAIVNVTKSQLYSLMDSENVVSAYDTEFLNAGLDGERSSEIEDIELETETMHLDLAYDYFGVSGDGVNVLMKESGVPISDPYNKVDKTNIHYVFNQAVYSYNDPMVNQMNGNDFGHSLETYHKLQTYAENVNIFASQRASYLQSYDEFTDIEWAVINCDIDIINVSGNYGFKTNYNDDAMSIWFDALASTYNLLIISSTGNNNNNPHTEVLSVAAGYNTIGAGAFYTDENGDSRLYDYRYSSNALPNTVQYKPDIVMHSGGTSKAAPILTAIASFIMELNPALKIQPKVVKAILLASCHQKALPYGTDPEELMTDGLTLKQGAGIVNAFLAIYITLHGNYGVGTIVSNDVNISMIDAPCTGDINVTLTWFRSNYYNNNSSPNNGVTGIEQDLALSVYHNNTLIKSSAHLKSGKQLAYFSATNGWQYMLKVSKLSNNNYPVSFAYAWSPKNTNEVVSCEITGKIACDQTLTAKAYNASNSLIPSNKLTYRWYSSPNGSSWTFIYGATSNTYQITSNEHLKYIKCEFFPANHSEYIPVVSETTTGEDYVIRYGDCNEDGIVDVSDAMMIQLYTSDLVELSENQYRAADVDGDGNVTISDATLIQMYSGGVISIFPVET